MTDGVIKGSGNSRYLKTVANALSLYPTWQDGLAAMIAGTFPIDLYGINASGWQVRGIDLKKSNLLTDAAEVALWGNAANRTVDAAFKRIGQHKVTTGTYTGAGSSGTADVPVIINFGFKASVVFIFKTESYLTVPYVNSQEQIRSVNSNLSVYVDYGETGYHEEQATQSGDSKLYYVRYRMTENGLERYTNTSLSSPSAYTASALIQNTSNVRYLYVAIQ